MLRPYGYTPGHSLEWARLLLQLRAQLSALSGPGHDWMLDAAQHLFSQAVADGWDRERTGLGSNQTWGRQDCEGEQDYG